MTPRAAAIVTIDVGGNCINRHRPAAGIYAVEHASAIGGRRAALPPSKVVEEIIISQLKKEFELELKKQRLEITEELLNLIMDKHI